MRQIKLCLLGSLPGFLLLTVAGSSLGGFAQTRDDAGSRAAFLETYKVFMHPRCVNCHPAGDAPLRGENSSPHDFLRLRRGADGQGVFAVKCGNCHQAQNQPGLHMPPGAPYPLKDGAEDQAHRNEPAGICLRCDADGLREANAGAVVHAITRQKKEWRADSRTIGSARQPRPARVVGMESWRRTKRAAARPRRVRPKSQ